MPKLTEAVTPSKSSRTLRVLIMAICAVIGVVLPPLAVADDIQTRIGQLEIDHGLPSPGTREKLYDELDFQRAVQSVIWAEPLINNALFLKAMQQAGVANLGGMVYDKSQQPGQETLTPNQSVIYLYDSINLKDTGPVVHIVPPGPINAGLFDMWMRPVLDFGTVGVNKGEGDRILIVPPGYQGEVPEGYTVARPKTWQIFSITRLTTKQDMNAAQAVDLFRKVQTYPLSQAAKPPAKQLVLMGDPASGGKTFRMNRPAGLDYWRLLHDSLAAETLEPRDLIPLGGLAPLGLERNKPFAPDTRLQKILVDAEQVGRLMMVNEAFSPRQYPEGITKNLFPGTHWENIQIIPDMSQDGPDYSYVTERMIGFYQANGAQFIWAPRDFPPGFGQKYVAAYQDKAGAWLSGDKTYRLHVPAKVPVADFWALTVYDVDTRAIIETSQHLAELNSVGNSLKANSDGSLDLYFGPKAPAGMEKNWIQTLPGKGWFAYFRLYGPTEPFYDKSWKLQDFERVE